ncbi:AP-2 complex subunit alpha-2-like isoform X2 [Hylaeus volcanicus]|uniref:AP-2 complex subunit alpha-2-like isoform X2 n=1 Tax=Hylaeus volcanicus TaxID=313075 RepID=UPI0023B7ED64|nr:AP-2 complex subunit alpha-2-like isoform X2 [Hylaeus volcanicus]
MQSSSCRKQFRGLHKFIQDIRSSTCKANEAGRVEEELANIRIKFYQNKNLKTCELMKAVWKLIYCYMLGYQVTIGRFESIVLVASPKYFEKQTGYIACSILFRDSVKMLNLLSNSIKRDLKSRSIPIVTLALNFLANSPCDDIVDHVFADVVNLTLFHKSFDLQGRAYLVLLYFFRCRPSCFGNLDLWVAKIIKHFEKDAEKENIRAIVLFTLGLLESSISEINTVRLLTPIINTLSRVVFDRKLTGNTYYGISDPWMQINLLRVFQFFSPDIISDDLLEHINRIVRNILSRSLTLPNLASYIGCRGSNMETIQEHRCKIAAIFFEAVHVLSVFSPVLDATVKYQATDLLLQLCSIHDHNIRYLALQSLSSFAVHSDILNITYPITQNIIKQLDEPDDCLRHQAMNLLCNICQKSTYNLIFCHLFKYLTISLDQPVIEDLLVKMIYLIEKHSENFQEYIDTVFMLLSCEKNSCNDQLWRRIVQVITQMDSENHKAQAYAAYKAFTFLMGACVKKELVKLSAYILGEFGHLIYSKVTQEKQYEALCYHLHDVDTDVKIIFLVALLKVGYDNKKIIKKVSQIFRTYSASKHLPVAQRAQEFIVLLTLDTASLETILACMPVLPKNDFNMTNLIRPSRLFTLKKGVPSKNLQDISRSQDILLRIPRLKETFSFTKDTNTSSFDKASSSSNDGSSTETRTQTNVQFAQSSFERYEDHLEVFNQHEEHPNRCETVTTTDDLSPFPLWSQLCLLPKGLLCDENPVQAFVNQTYNQGEGQLQITWKNMTQEPIILDSLTVEPCIGLAQKIIYDPTLQNVAVLHNDASEVQHVVRLRLTSAFLHSPRYFCRGIYEISKKQFLIKTTLPTCMFSYMVPSEIKTEAIPQDGITVTRIGQSRFPYAESMKEISKVLSAGFHMNVIRKKNKVIGNGLLEMKPIDENSVNMSCSIHVCLKNADLFEVKVNTMDAASSDYLSQLTCSYIFTSEFIH